MERHTMAVPGWPPGLEHLHMSPSNDRIATDSIIIGIEDHIPYRSWYEMVCDTNWKVRELGLILLSSRSRSIKIRSDGEGHWTTISGEPVSSLDGCIDVDISVTPFTNTLPIRRLALSPGQSAELQVVYVTIPEMELKPARQRYTCLDLSAQGGIYRYEGLASGFTTEFPVDKDGLVIDYPGLWKRVTS